MIYFDFISQQISVVKTKRYSISYNVNINFSGPIGFASVGSLAYSSIFPSTSVMVNWHQQGCLTHLKDQWLIDAAVRLNPKLRLSPKCQQVRYLNQNAQYISVKESIEI